jgi:hypothetical protein
MAVRTQFTQTEVATRVLMGPVNPRAGIISRGRIMSETQKTPKGGIHAVLRMRAAVRVDCDTYSTQALQKIVRIRLISGAMMNPKRPKRKWEKAGKKRARAKLKRVRITPWTTPNVRRRA